MVMERYIYLQVPEQNYNMLFDTHTHPYMTFKKTPEVILDKFFTDNYQNKCVSIACNIDSSLQSIDFAQKYDRLYATIGFHPCDIPYTSYRSFTNIDIKKADNIDKKIDSDMQILRDIYQKNKQYIVAIWEIGLDEYHLENISQKTWLDIPFIQWLQMKYFEAQVRLAKELMLPCVIHSRETNDKVFEILQQEIVTDYVFHCFSWSWEFIEKVLKQNSKAMFGFWGILTFKKSYELHKIIRKIPLNNIIIETDSPFLTPEPLRGKEENEPIFVKHVLTKLQQLRSENSKEIQKAVYENATRFYNA